jgi:hypothetical protein
MALKSIEEEWQGFAAMVFRNVHPSDTQLAEMKKAFFAGAWAMFCATAEIGCDHVSEDEGFAFLEARRSECEDFKRRLMAEYAGKN